MIFYRSNQFSGGRLISQILILQTYNYVISIIYFSHSVYKYFYIFFINFPTAIAEYCVLFLSEHTCKFQIRDRKKDEYVQSIAKNSF